MRILKPVLLTLLSCVVLTASAAERVEVLVLGTFHMANPGRDLFNTKADDMLAPKRQAEIAEVIETLKRFAPTKIAVERTAGDERIAKDYADYLAGTHQLTRNEIEQLGFRLAKELGHKAVYAVDADGEFPFPCLVKYAQATGRSKEIDALMSEVGGDGEGAECLAGTPRERILVIYGSGHLGWLQYTFAGNPRVKLRKLGEFAK